VALEEGWCWERVLRGARVRAAASIEPGAPNPTATLAEMPAAAMREPLQEDRENVSQYLVRHRTEEAGETLDGWVRAEFVPTQRHAIAHVAICPPFERTPRCYAEISDGPSGEVKIAQVLPYGVRFEIKLDEPAAEAASVMVEFSIQELGPVEDERSESDEQ
jgi:hypothetical protein